LGKRALARVADANQPVSAGVLCYSSVNGRGARSADDEPEAAELTDVLTQDLPAAVADVVERGR